MRRIILAVLFLSVLTVFAASCSANRPSAQNILAKIVEEQNTDPSAGKLYFCDSQKDIAEDGYLSYETKRSLFESKTSFCADFEKLEDFAIFTSAKTDAYEIDIFFVRNGEDIPSFEKMLNARLASIKAAKNSFDEVSQKRIADGKVLTLGRCVALLITKDNALAEKIIKRSVGYFL